MHPDHSDIPESWRTALAPVEEKLSDLQRPGTMRWLHYAMFPVLQACGIVLIIHASGASWPAWATLLAYGGGILLVAAALNAYFLLIHEAIHGLLVQSSWGNRILGALLATMGGISATSYKVMHIRHHRHLGHEDDPDDYRNYVESDRAVWLLQINRLIWATFIYVVALPILSWKYGSAEERRRIAQEYAGVLLASAMAVYLVPVSLLILAWAIPLLITNFMINVRGLSQHGSTDSSHPLTASRTVTPGPILRFFLINENYHLEHHLYPSVPADRLPELHRELNRVLPLRVIHKGYLAYLWDFFRTGPTRADQSLGVQRRKGF
jgi:fatty acid desaturase